MASNECRAVSRMATDAVSGVPLLKGSCLDDQLGANLRGVAFMDHALDRSGNEDVTLTQEDRGAIGDELRPALWEQNRLDLSVEAYVSDSFNKIGATSMLSQPPSLAAPLKKLIADAKALTTAEHFDP